MSDLVPNTLAGFKSAFFDASKRPLTEQDIFDAGVRSGMARAGVSTASAPTTDPARLSEADINTLVDSMPGGLKGFLKGWGWLNFARAVEDESILLNSKVMRAEGVPQIKPRLLNQLRRFNECCGDSEADGHDLDREDMHSLAELGAVRPAPGGRHYMTDFGHYLLAAPAPIRAAREAIEL
jgi:hypothetical protein